ncbi:MAG: sigma-70 family RNA polymerase sigma factor [Candidatus Paceibacterota bacterium]
MEAVYLMDMAKDGAAMSDEEIVKKVQSGDAERFGVLVERYEARLHRYAKKFLLDGDEGADAVQEAFIKAYVNIQSFDAARKFSSWIYRIAHNECINAIKKKRGKITLSLPDFDVLLPHLVAQETTSDEMERKQMRQELDQSLEKLDAKYREPLVLYYFEELDYQEIADVLGIPTATVGVRLRRGREALRRVIESKG